VTEPEDKLTRLCLACGLCCDGTLFKDVELQAGDDAAQVVALGLPVKGGKFPQPCPALGADKCCRVYADRPARCRQFECTVFLELKHGAEDLAGALRIVAQTRKLADKVRRLLRQLGDDDEALALSLRFQKMKRALEQGAFEDESVETAAELTLAVRDLTRNLARFYPPA
jgi:Fe-S-cluster containining protein